MTQRKARTPAVGRRVWPRRYRPIMGKCLQITPHNTTQLAHPTWAPTGMAHIFPSNSSSNSIRLRNNLFSIRIHRSIRRTRRMVYMHRMERARNRFTSRGPVRLHPLRTRSMLPTLLERQLLKQRKVSPKPSLCPMGIKHSSSSRISQHHPSQEGSFCRRTRLKVSLDLRQTRRPSLLQI